MPKASKRSSSVRHKAVLAAIKRVRGSLKRGPGQKPFAKGWAEQKAEEKELEDCLVNRFFRRG